MVTSAEAIAFDPPAPGGIDLLIVAGEHSGDQHAAVLVRQLLARDSSLRIAALGGPALAAAGAHLVSDLTQLSVVGLVEVLKHYSVFKRLFDATVELVERDRPRGIILVDYPGFNLRLAHALQRRGLSRKGGGSVWVYQYISPQIWAWKAKRRFAMAKVLDELGVIFPFELDCYLDTDLPVHFVGHPFVQKHQHNPLSFDPAGPVLLLPGSRLQPVARIFPLMLDVVAHTRAQGQQTEFCCLYSSRAIHDLLARLLEGRGLLGAVKLQSVAQPAVASMVLTSSGTMSLYCALAAIPGAIVYRAHPLTAWLGKRLIRVPWLGIANLILDRCLYREFIQSGANAPALLQHMSALQVDPQAAVTFATGAMELTERLSPPTDCTLLSRIQFWLAQETV